MTSSNSTDEDLQAQQQALNREEEQLNAAATKLSSQKLAEAREKIAEAREKVVEAQERINAHPLTIPNVPSVPKIIIQKDSGNLLISDGTTAYESASPTPHHKSSHSSSSDGTSAVTIVAIVFTFGWLSIKAIANAIAGRNTGRGGGGRLSREEQAIMEKLHRSLSQMENRIESLETILVETRKSKESYGTKF